ncbi:MAG TPA: acetylornithine deacetylase, partial [Algoriphagus sp.]|nr:acetylornithine deacetylase [Algoriphagus sp.]
MKNTIFILFLFLSSKIIAQVPSQSELEQMTSDNWQSGVKLLNEIVAMPNDAVYPEQIEVNILWCERQFGERAWSSERLDTGGIPLLLAQKNQPGATQTVLF